MNNTLLLFQIELVHSALQFGILTHYHLHYFAVLVAESGTTKPQLAVDNWADVTVKFLHHVRNSTERSDFLRFNAYICHVIDDFACFELQH